MKKHFSATKYLPIAPARAAFTASDNLAFSLRREFTSPSHDEGLRSIKFSVCSEVFLAAG
jgi:hypothetical protein